jgi:hypothetical protein
LANSGKLTETDEWKGRARKSGNWRNGSENKIFNETKMEARISLALATVVPQ